MSLIWKLVRWARRLPPSVLTELVNLAVALAKGQSGEDEAKRVVEEQARLAAFDELMRQRRK
jgi:hypothetical protein